MLELEKLNIRWVAQTDISVGRDEELLGLLRRSGCILLLIGFESLSTKNLHAAMKGFNHPDKYSLAMQTFHKYGFSINGTFVFGMDADTPAVFEETARFAIDNKIDLPRYAILTPFPNTTLYHRLKKEERILTEDWSLYDGQHVVFQPSLLNALLAPKQQ